MNRVNRRDGFRVRVFDVTCQLNITDVSGEAVSKSAVQTQMLDLSVTGCSLASPLDLPVSGAIRCTLEFTVRGEAFRLVAEVVRKADDRRPHRYGFLFRELPAAEEARLMRTLMAIDAARRG